MPSWKRKKYRRNKKLRARAADTQPSGSEVEKHVSPGHPPSPPPALPNFQVLPTELRFDIWCRVASPPKWQPIRRWIALTYHVEYETHDSVKVTRPETITVRPGQPDNLFVNTEARDETERFFRDEKRLLTVAMSDKDPPRQIHFNYDCDILYLPGENAVATSNAAETMAFWSTSFAIPVEQRDRIRHLAIGYFNEKSLSVQHARLAFCEGLRKLGHLKSLRMVMKKIARGPMPTVFEREHGGQPELFFRRMVEDFRQKHQEFSKVRVMVCHEGSQGRTGQGARRRTILDRESEDEVGGD
ncbi:uncharacterized protein BDZ99DRAFT_518622 [Mytilinidion resinicola]|uniref:2EXR domain-containing protein n=1 Tax=Mytilinidion resinicola TaxID=574789 RepID=A0A6A6YSJ7_9PEZI|nr:uncharacterized protein BDZ99DRAFT_518622 [Mytilinidion resinicola]KAF2811343.1 hypothetical protein BDZ99DRAFT_518622 [Mytilinidion resinicola]